ncbi:unnamed protein product [Ectocarpus sp. 12 AP-2014]
MVVCYRRFHEIAHTLDRFSSLDCTAANAVLVPPPTMIALEQSLVRGLSDHELLIVVSPSLSGLRAFRSRIIGCGVTSLSWRLRAITIAVWNLLTVVRFRVAR